MQILAQANNYRIILFSWQLTRKNLMVKNLKRLRKQIEREHGKTAATKYPKPIAVAIIVAYLRGIQS